MKWEAYKESGYKKVIFSNISNFLPWVLDSIIEFNLELYWTSWETSNKFIFWRLKTMWWTARLLTRSSARRRLLVIRPKIIVRAGPSRNVHCRRRLWPSTPPWQGVTRNLLSCVPQRDVATRRSVMFHRLEPIWQLTAGTWRVSRCHQDCHQREARGGVYHWATKTM